MGYIKFVLSVRKTDDKGNTTRTVISRVESDMADTDMLETNLIMHGAFARRKNRNKGGRLPVCLPVNIWRIVLWH